MDHTPAPAGFPLDRIGICAEVAAGWHAAWLAALGIGSGCRRGAWVADGPPPFIYWAGIALAPNTPASVLSEAPGTVCDSWALLDLTAAGFREADGDAWMWRDPGALPDGATPAELEIAAASTPDRVVEFEAIGVRGFQGEDARVAPGSLHPPAILANPAMRMLTGTVSGAPVAAAMSYRTARAVGIFGVATVTGARRRGYATALTRALIDPALPTVLASGPETETLYRQLGFRTVGELRHWTRPD